MKNSLFASVVTAILLFSGCSKIPPETQALLENPLYAESYYADLTEQYVQMLMGEKADLEEKGQLEFIESERDAAVQNSKDASAKRKQGLWGVFVPLSDNPIGRVAVLGSTLYLGPEFLMEPSVEPHIYVSEVIDPRDSEEFPDPTSIDVGPVLSPYGTQQHVIPWETPNPKIKSVILYDKKLKRQIGFAQLQSQ